MSAPVTERVATCPRCAEPVRLTREELIDKRGFCALCDTRFDITEHRLSGASPFRDEARVALTPVTPQPPTTRMKNLSTDGLRRTAKMSRRDILDVRAEQIVTSNKNGTTVTHVVKVIGSGKDSLVLAEDAGAPREALEWLAAHVRDALHR